MGRRLIVLIDSGDTLIDESTEVRDENGDVRCARLIPGAKEALRALRDRGYPAVLVADGTFNSFERVHRLTGIYDLLTDRVYSETLGVEKPDRAMFECALAKRGLTLADAGRAIMVGNNLARDINGANRLGIRSVLLTWSKARPQYSDAPDQQPDYRIAELSELPPLCDQIEDELRRLGI
ncbi:MAG: HAD family hydrolase [Clostridiales bacterium]|nr:HAD family hydrolase [Clostridiales bacterium]